jgi:hypothetical protein
MPPSENIDRNQICAELAELISSRENKELECRKYLRFAKDLLTRETVKEYVYVESERRGNAGDSDYIISGKIDNEAGYESVQVYIWELKAPQCHIFKKDTENRLIPTPELFHAENQLFHYYQELQGDTKFRNDFRITHPDYVRMGGIIIGSTATWISGQVDDAKKPVLLENMLMIRGKYVYDPNHIRLMNWNNVLDHIRATEQPRPLENEKPVEGITITEALDVRMDAPQ